MKVYDNYLVNGYVPGEIARLMREKTGAPQHIGQFSLYVSGKTKADALEYLSSVVAYRPRLVDFRVASGNGVDALIDAGLFEGHRILVSNLTTGNRDFVLDAETQEVIGQIKRSADSMTRRVFIPEGS